MSGHRRTRSPPKADDDVLELGVAAQTLEPLVGGVDGRRRPSPGQSTRRSGRRRRRPSTSTVWVERGLSGAGVRRGSTVALENGSAATRMMLGGGHGCPRHPAPMMRSRRPSSSASAGISMHGGLSRIRSRPRPPVRSTGTPGRCPCRLVIARDGLDGKRRRAGQPRRPRPRRPASLVGADRTRRSMRRIGREAPVLLTSVGAPAMSARVEGGRAVGARGDVARPPWEWAPSSVALEWSVESRHVEVLLGRLRPCDEVGSTS